jgi:hypothetical protein
LYNTIASIESQEEQRRLGLTRFKSSKAFGSDPGGGRWEASQHRPSRSSNEILRVRHAGQHPIPLILNYGLIIQGARAGRA